MAKKITPELREAAPDMLAFLKSISGKTQLSLCDQAEVQRLISAATTALSPDSSIPVKSLQQVIWDTFHRFYLANYETEFLYSKEDARHFKTITAFLEKKASERGLPLSNTGQIALGFNTMLGWAFRDKFLHNNFRPGIIAQQINPIYVGAKNRHQVAQTSTVVDTVANLYS